MKASRITAISLIAAATGWIASGYLVPHEHAESQAAITTKDQTAQKLFRVAVAETTLVPHSRKLVLSGRTEADRKVTAVARTGGVLTELRVRRGDRVEKGDVIAVLSDEAREAQVAQALALLMQKKAELEARRKLVENGTMPRLDLGNLEAHAKAAEAGLAAAEAERDRGVVRAPWSGIVTDTNAEVGQAAFSMAGREIAQIVALDPMLAVVEVAERKLAGVKVGDMAEVRFVTGQTATGRIRFVSKSASQTTRTYRIEVEMQNPAGAIPDGITCEVAIPMAPMMAARVPRSALTLSSSGDVGVRAVNPEGIVRFHPVAVIEDNHTVMWVTGLSGGTQVIVQGQDFVREGQRVETVPAEMKTAGQ